MPRAPILHRFAMSSDPSRTWSLCLEGRSGWVRTGTYRKRPRSIEYCIDGFWIDRTPVTNADFRTFVRATGYVTMAERRPDPKDYPGALQHMLKPGSLVFKPPRVRGRTARLERVVAL